MAAASQLSLPPATVSKFVNSDSARRGKREEKKNAASRCRRKDRRRLRNARRSCAVRINSLAEHQEDYADLWMKRRLRFRRGSRGIGGLRAAAKGRRMYQLEEGAARRAGRAPGQREPD